MPRSVRTVFYRAPRSNDADSNTGSLGWVGPFAKPIGFAAIDGRCQGCSSIQLSNSAFDAELSFRGDAKHRTRNLEIPRFAIAHLRSGANAPSRNDGGGYGFAFSRRDAPELCVVALQNKRAQGKPGARCTRGPVCDCYWQKGT